ncbi:MAG: hypothetical protein HPAVJP_5440 [Candidatus Hepatoplasma vulgare]|nr:MAG: hypothetical protein HPAVJP_5440 [Candidatus Hepatoplasma sp.]
MNIKTSFTDFVKYEILNFSWKEDDKKNLIISFLYFSKKNLTDDKLLAKIYLSKNSKDNLEKLIKEIINPDKLNIINTKNFFILDIELKNIKSKLTNFVNKIKLKNINDIKPILSAIFLAKGTITSPTSKFYHFELSFKDEFEGEIIFKLLKKIFKILNINFLLYKKEDKYHFYVKKATYISDLLKVMNASSSLLYFEDQRIARDFISITKKTESVEKYNKIKTHTASEKQIKAIKKLKKENKFSRLPMNLKNLANLRLENPGDSLSDLNYKYNLIYKANISRSTIDSWMKKIILFLNINE